MSFLRAARLFVLAACSFSAFAQSGAIPFIDQPLVPSAIEPGGAAFTLTVNGTGFQSKSVVMFNGSPLTTTYINPERLTALVPASKITSPQTAHISVSSGAGLLSNSAFLQIEITRPAVAFTLNPVAGVVPEAAFAVGDFNGDHLPDIVISVTNDIVEVLLGNGNGTFQDPIVVLKMNGVTQIITADLNGDGNLDIVVLGGSSRKSLVLLGNGNGTFQTPLPLPTTSTDLVSIAAGDFNGDGKLDLIYCVHGGPTALLLGNGDGTFIQGATLPSITSSDYVEAADFNGDGFLDVAVAASAAEGISIFLNDGTGNMVPAGALSGAAPEGSFVLADLNGDGVVDLASLDPSYSLLLVYLGNGDGTFQSPASYPIGNAGEGLAMGDFNGDGKLDLVAPWEQASSNAFSLFIGNGDGTFEPGRVYVDSGNFGLIPADFNNDGQLDLVGIETLGRYLTVFFQTSVLANPSGLTFPSIPVTTVSQPLAVTVSNIASTPLTISALHLAGRDPASFLLSTDLCSGQTIASGANCSFSVEFKPVAAGSSVAAVSISDTARVAPQSVVIRGTASEIEVSPSALNFGTVKVEHASAAQIVAITNPGVVEDAIGYSITGADPQDFLVESTCSSPLQPDTACSLFVRFIPTATGARTATINVDDGTYAIELPVTLSGTGN